MKAALLSGSGFQFGTDYQGDILADGPSHYWDFDTTGVSNDANLGNASGPAMGTTGVTRGDPALAQGLSWRFNGSSSEAETINTWSWASASTGSLEVWFDCADSAQHATLLGHAGVSGSSFGELIMIGTGASTPSKQISFFVLGGTVGGGSGALDRRKWTTDDDVVDGNKHHVVCTFNSGTPKIYVDGVDMALSVTFSQNSAPTAFENSFAKTSCAGFDLGFRYFQGNIDEPAFYEAALSQATAQAHYAAREL